MDERNHDERNHESRHLTDDDIKALATELKSQFYSNLGKGVWAVVWKAVIWGCIVVAAYGVTKGIK